MADDKGKGRFAWYELMTDDVEGARSFYGEVVGWSIQESQMPDLDYTMFATGDRTDAGLMALPAAGKKKGVPPHWMSYVVTDDVDATVKLAEELGGKVLVPAQDVPQVGRFALVADPQGAALSPYKPAEPLGEAPERALPGQVAWRELYTSDHESALAFYSQLYGWQKTSSMDMGKMGVYQMWGRDSDKSLGGMMNLLPDMPADMPASPHWIYYFNVDDVDAAAERVKTNGGKVFNGPMDVPGGDRIAMCRDPQGAVFALQAHGSVSP